MILVWGVQAQGLPHLTYMYYSFYLQTAITFCLYKCVLGYMYVCAPSGSKARNELPEAKMCGRWINWWVLWIIPTIYPTRVHIKRLLENTKKKERQSYLVEGSSEILTQVKEGVEATNHTGEQHEVNIAILCTQEVLHNPGREVCVCW